MQFIITAVPVPVNIAFLASLASNTRSFASVFTESHVGLVAPFSDVIEAIRTMWAVNY